MKITIKKRWLVLPTSHTAKLKKLMFSESGSTVYELDLRLDCVHADGRRYIDMGRFMGRTLEVDIRPEIAFVPEFADVSEDGGFGGEKYRPAAHFTAAGGWINDPNGLCRYGELYHLFFQHNPAGSEWGNMHWGHAVSRDLMHWEHRDIALFPDELGTMFSGSAIVDERNVTGLKQNDNNVMLLFYTAAGGTSKRSEGRKFSQCIAYSTDGGSTFIKYAKNPVIETVTGENRDPKVIYHPASGLYYLVLYLSENKFALFVSYNLLDWKHKQDLILPEDGECPDFYPLRLQGTEEEYWVFSGASDRYLVGRIGSDGYFAPVQEAKRLHYGKNSYASQTFSGQKDGRTIRMSWNTASVPAAAFQCAMCTPAEMTLREIHGEKTLCAEPAREIAALYKNEETYRDRSAGAGESIRFPLPGRAQDIELQLPAETPAMTLSLLGLDLEIDPAAHMLKCMDRSMPLFETGGHIRLRIVTDSSAVEIYAGRGEAFMCMGHMADYNLDALTLSGAADFTVSEARVRELSDIRENR